METSSPFLKASLLSPYFSAIYRVSSESYVGSDVFKWYPSFGLGLAIIVWGSAYKSNIKVLQMKQNHIVRIIFFPSLYGKNTESPLPLINLLDILTVDHICELQALRYIRKWRLKSGVSSCQRSTAVADIARLPVFVLKQVLYRLSLEAYLVLCKGVDVFGILEATIKDWWELLCPVCDHQIPEERNYIKELRAFFGVTMWSNNTQKHEDVGNQFLFPF